MRARSLLLASLTLVPALWGCTGIGASPRTVDPDEIAELKARVIELQRKAAVDEVEIARLRQQVAELAGGRAGSGTSAPRRPAHDTAPRDLEESQTIRPPASPAPIEEADIDIAPPRGNRVPALPPPPPPPVLPPSRKPSPPRPAPSAPSEPPPSPAPGEAATIETGESGHPVPPAAQALYDRGYSLYNQGHYVDAEASFQRFLQSEPASDLSDNALYWIGECRYSRGDLKGALAAFRETVERFPNANKVPDALLKAGETLEALHDVEGARVTYREVIRRFPGTAAAALADERRAKLH